MKAIRQVAVLVVALLVVAAGCAASDPADPGAAAGAPPSDGAGSGGAAMPAGVKLLGASVEHDTDPQVTPDELAVIVDGQNQLGIDLYRALASGSEANLVLSPWSVSTDLAMVHAGAAGATAAELGAVLHVDGIAPERVPVATNRLGLDLLARQREKVELAAANKLWTDEGLTLRPPFLDTMSRSFGAPVAAADFSADAESARLAINEWTAGQTGGRIRDLFPPGTVDANTALVLVNAVSLNAEWFFPFNPDLTGDEPFTRLDGTQVTVPMMHFNEYLPTASGPGWRAVEIPYSGDELSMVVVVPDELRSFEAALDRPTLDAVFASLADGGVHLSLPRFSFSSHASLVEPLRSLGLRSAFDPTADFSGMTDGGGLFIGAVEHGAFVKVDEVGTEAAAATGTAMADSHGPTIPVTRPFLFAIRDRATGAVLFLGRVVDPTLTGE